MIKSFKKGIKSIKYKIKRRKSTYVIWNTVCILYLILLYCIHSIYYFYSISMVLNKFRSSRPECSMKKVFLKLLPNLKENTSVETFRCFTKFSFHHKSNDVRLLLIKMVYTSCLMSCKWFHMKTRLSFRYFVSYCW